MRRRPVRPAFPWHGDEPTEQRGIGEPRRRGPDAPIIILGRRCLDGRRAAEEPEEGASDRGLEQDDGDTDHAGDHQGAQESGRDLRAVARAIGLRREARRARGGRLLPGEGALPLRDLLTMAPSNARLSVEVPNAGLPAERNAKALFDMTMALLGRWRSLDPTAQKNTR